jgi:hypothetical protein
LLFTGLLINREKVPYYLRWLLTVSFFHAAYEAMIVNELRYLKLHEVKVRTCVGVIRNTSLTMTYSTVSSLTFRRRASCRPLASALRYITRLLLIA